MGSPLGIGEALPGPAPTPAPAPSLGSITVPEALAPMLLM